MKFFFLRWFTCLLCVLLNLPVLGEAIQVGSFMGVSGDGIAIDFAPTGNILEGRVLENAETRTVLSSDLIFDEFGPAIPPFFILTLTNDSGVSIESLDLSLGLASGSAMDFGSSSIPTLTPGSLTLNGMPQIGGLPSFTQILTQSFTQGDAVTLSFQLDFPDTNAIDIGSNLAIGLTAAFVPEPTLAMIFSALAFFMVIRRGGG